jgi:hypothetical protein
MWIYLLIGILLLYVLYKERQALGCKTIPDGSDCDNANGKAVKGTEPHPRDTIEKLYSKIEKASKFMDRWVMWRMALLLSFVCIMLIYFFLYQRIPTEEELVVGMFIITSLLYFTMNFYKFHLVHHIEKNIKSALNNLISKLRA